MNDDYLKSLVDIVGLEKSIDIIRNADYIYKIYKTCTECDSLYEGEGCDTCQKRREENIDKLLDIDEN
jgi:recombinational DNA repair protein RecR